MIDEPTRVDRDDGWHYCDLCDARYRNMGAALQCCGDRFSTDDNPDSVPDGGTIEFDAETCVLCGDDLEGALELDTGVCEECDEEWGDVNLDGTVEIHYDDLHVMIDQLEMFAQIASILGAEEIAESSQTYVEEYRTQAIEASVLAEDH